MNILDHFINKQRSGLFIEVVLMERSNKKKFRVTRNIIYIFENWNKTGLYCKPNQCFFSYFISVSVNQ